MVEHISAYPRWPGDGKDFRVTMGLHVCAPDDWLLRGSGVDELIANKIRVLQAAHDDAVAVLPEGDAAAREAAQTIFTDLARHTTDGAHLFDPLLMSQLEDEQHPLERVSRLIAEDVCVMTPHAVRDGVTVNAADQGQGHGAQSTGGRNAPGRAARESVDTDEQSDVAATGDTVEYRLTAAVLCAPSRWSLREKLGASLRTIHAPVPGYDSIAAPSDRFFERLPVGEIMERTNWSVLSSPELFQPGNENDRTGEFHETQLHDPAKVHLAVGRNAESVLANRWLRLERQTLRKLPRTGAVVFTILTTNTRLDDLAAREPETARQLAHKMRTAPVDTRAYKGWANAEVIVDALEAACSAA